MFEDMMMEIEVSKLRRMCECVIMLGLDLV